MKDQESRTAVRSPNLLSPIDLLNGFRPHSGCSVPRNTIIANTTNGATDRLTVWVPLLADLRSYAKYVVAVAIY